MRPSRALAAVPTSALLLALAGCGAGRSAQGSGPATVPSATTKAPPSATLPSASSSPAPGESRRGTAPQGNRAPAPDGDVDGDGLGDKLSFGGPGVLQVAYSAGGSETVQFGTGAAPSEDRILGASDADRDGHAEVFVLFDQGAYVSLTTVFRYVGGHLRIVTMEGNQVALASGGSTGSVTSWACRPSGAPDTAIVIMSGGRSETNVYDITTSDYAFAESRLILQRNHALGPTPLSKLPTPQDEISGAAGCGSAALP